MRHYLFLILIAFLITFSSTGQVKDSTNLTSCGTPSLTREQAEAMSASFSQFQKSNKNSRLQGIQAVSLPIKIHIVLQDNGYGDISSSLNNVFSNLNFWFANMGVSFYQYGNIDYIYSTSAYYFNNSDESSLLDSYAANNAINIFFVGTFPDRGANVTGYAKFPIGDCCPSSQSYSTKNSNALFISTNFSMKYQAEKTIPHEMGHYFGLLHTHETYYGNERVNGSNCSSAGDQICDTPADPYEIITGVEVCKKKYSNGTCYWGCTNTDANGNIYNPQLDNIMSYYDGCGGRITAGQYNRMIWGYNVRTNPNPDLYSRYYIDGQLRFTYQANQSSLCVGSNLNLTFWQFGEFNSGNNFKIQISSNNGASYTDLSTLRNNKNSLQATIPSNLTQGNYKFRVVSTNPYIEAGASDVSISSTPTATISGNSEIFQTQSTDLKVQFTGISPWSFKLSDGTQITNTYNNPHIVKVTPNATTTYSIANLNNQCGNGTFSGSSAITVKPLTIATGDIAQSEICVESILNVPFTVNYTFPATSTFVVQLSDKDGNNFVNVPTQGNISPLKITIPNNLATSKNYKLRVVSSSPNVTGDANKTFIINSKPNITITKEEKIENFILKSNSQIGNQWLLEGKEISNANDSLLIPEKIGNYSARVSKGGCVVNSTNSILIKIDKPNLELEGENPFCDGSSAKLKAPKDFGTYMWFMGKDTLKNTSGELVVKNTGSLRVLVGRGKILSPQSDTLKIKTKPLPPKPTVSLENNGLKSSSTSNNQWLLSGIVLKDSTGQILRGVNAGAYTVRVTENGCVSESDAFLITSTEPVQSEFTMKLYPNPNEGTFWVEIPQTFKAWKLDIFDIQGKQLFSKLHLDKNSNREQVEIKGISGTYILRVTIDNTTQSLKFIIE